MTRAAVYNRMYTILESMHPRFIEFIERLSERPHHHRKTIAFSTAFLLTALLVGGRFYFFPISSVQTGSTATIAGVADSFSRMKSDLTDESAKVWEEVNKMKDGNDQLTKPEGVPGALPVGTQDENAAPAGWMPDPNGGPYYVEYPTAVDNGQSSGATTTTY